MHCETHREGLQTAPEKTFQNSLSTGTRDSCTMIRNSSRHKLPIWAEPTPRRARAQTLPHRRPTSEQFAELLAWQSATSLRQRRTYGPLSPRRCCSPWSWQSSPSRGTRSSADRVDGYLDIRAAVTCNLSIDIKSYSTTYNFNIRPFALKVHFVSSSRLLLSNKQEYFSADNTEKEYTLFILVTL